MARTCGIRVGRRRFEVVALEGNAKKPRVVASISGEIPDDPDDPAGAAQAALKEALAKLRFKPEEVGLAVDSGLAAFRNVTLPFEDEAKIEQVLKFEVESQLPQWDIDDVAVDFHLLDSTGVESQLLVTAVKKDDLWGPLTACERAGMEAHEVELEATAVVNAAAAAGAFHVDSAEVLVHVGESSTTLIVVDGGKLRSMRALHIGALAGPEGEPGEGGEGSAELDRVSLAERALEEIVPRVRREIVRTLTAAQTANPLRAILVCGDGLPGLEGDVVQDVPVERLDPIPEDAGDLDGERGQFAAAYGAALGRMGGGIVTARLRREELKFTGAFERLELPVAVVSLLLLIVLLMQFLLIHTKAGLFRADMRTWMQATNNYMVGVKDDGIRGIIGTVPEELETYAERALGDVQAGESDRSVYEHLLTVKAKLAAEVQTLERKLGRDGAVTKPQSALDATTAVLGVIDGLDDRVGRFSIRSLSADFRSGTASRDDWCEVRLDMSFFADSGDVAASHYDALVNELRAQPWCLEVVDAPTKAFDGGGGISADGIRVSVDTTKIERPAQR